MERKPLGKQSTRRPRIPWERFFTQRTKKPGFLASVLVLATKMIAVALAAVMLACGGLVLGIAKAYVEASPTLDLQSIEDQDLTSFIYDADGNLITEYSGVENRVYASLSEIPDDLINAFIAVEDVRFFTHPGVDFKRLVGALVKNFTSSSMEGGSTITQQLVRNSMLTIEQTYKRKLQEAYLSYELEGDYTKEQILEAYLNVIPLGEGNYGVKTAAMDYFDKDLSELTLRECAMIAGLTKSPAQYSPRRNYVRYPADAGITDARTETVLNAMYANNDIDRAQYDAALNEKTYVVPVSTRNLMYDMPYAVEYVVSDVVSHLIADRGLPDTGAHRTAVESEIRKGGYRIYSTIRPQVQHAVEDALFNWENYPRLNPEYASKSVKRVQMGTAYVEIPEPQSAAAVIDWRTGTLAAIVGGREQPTQRKLLNRATQSMPVGSSIKPLSVYGPALDLGISPAQPVPNFGLPIVGWDSENGYPGNFSTSKTTPMVSIRRAIRSSFNIGAAHTLMDFVGVEQSEAYLVSLGIDPSHIHTDDAKDASTPFGLALGGAGPDAVEMAAAFAAIANQGRYLEPVSFTRVTDAHGGVLLDMEDEQQRVSRQVFQPATAWLLVDLLGDAIEGTGSGAILEGMSTIGKTGTNSDYRGVTFAGVTPYYAASLWIGHDDYTPALYDGATGGKEAAPLWKAFMAPIHADLEDKPIIEGDGASFGLVKATVCGVSGLLPTEACALDHSGTKVVTDWFYPDSVPTETCPMHQTVHMCVESGHFAGPLCPEEARSTAAVVLIDPESDIMFENMTQEIADASFPGALVGLDYWDLSAMSSTNPATARYFCPTHTPAWYAAQGLEAPVPQYTSPVAGLSPSQGINGVDPSYDAGNGGDPDDASGYIIGN